jgi:eukaryotic-like serine/threonine-protein kinase
MSAPFDAWVKKTRNDFAAPLELVRDLPEGVDWAIRRAMSSDPQLRPATCGEFVADIVRATELEAEADSWELVFESLDGPSELLRVDTASVRQLLKRGNLRGRILARRSSTASFAPLDSFPEFRNTLPTPVPNTSPAPNRAPTWTKTSFGDETPKTNNANLLFNFLLALVVLAVGFALTALLKF